MTESNGLAPGLAIIFDLDGVIIDSNDLHTEAWIRYLADLGIHIDNLRERMLGKRNDQIVAEFISPDLSAAETFRHGADKEKLYRGMIGDRLRDYLIPGVGAFLARYAAHAPVGLGTNAEPPNVDFVLGGAGFFPHFRAIVNGHQVERPKPDPEVYRKVAAALEVDPRNCIIFEDSPSGIRAALAAGARVVGVRPEAEFDRLSLQIRDFHDERLAPWLATLAPRF
jgi:beta-phosphoglucomutase-like phosphatase (HAD superfamily)